MKILVLCDQGNNRSVTLAGQLKYMDHDVLTAGVATNSRQTVAMLSVWADVVIVVDETIAATHAMPEWDGKMQVRELGPDRYPRPFNSELLAKVKEIIRQNKQRLQPAE